MTARDSILETIGQKLGPRTASQADIVAEAEALIADPSNARPRLNGTDLVRQFIDKATSERVTATVETLSAVADIPKAVRSYLDTLGHNSPISLQPEPLLTDLDWTHAELDEQPAIDGAAAVTVAEYGIAETGSIVIRSGKASPVLLNFLPLTHIVVLKTNRILPYTEDLWSKLGLEKLRGSRLLSLITGTSGTADIEAKNVRGAHGPRNMMILLVEES